MPLAGVTAAPTCGECASARAVSLEVLGNSGASAAGQVELRPPPATTRRPHRQPSNRSWLEVVKAGWEQGGNRPRSSNPQLGGSLGSSLGIEAPHGAREAHEWGTPIGAGAADGDFGGAHS